MASRGRRVTTIAIQSVAGAQLGQQVRHFLGIFAPEYMLSARIAFGSAAPVEGILSPEKA